MSTYREPPTLVLLAGVALVVVFAILLSGGRSEDNTNEAASADPAEKSEKSTMHDDQLAQATFGNGCFWCTEAVFAEVAGVRSAVSGYSGGSLENPTYRDVVSGTTGHAEVIQVTYDPEVITYPELLEIFWQTHDPTTLNRQGNDVGTQYRSIVFYHDDEQRRLAEEYKQKLDKSGAFDAPIVTEIAPFTKFYPAEDYHQNYFEFHGHEPYCQLVIRPKLAKLREVFSDKLKSAQ